MCPPTLQSASRTLCRRSDSLTRNSSAPRTRVRPCATQPASARIGSSSTRLGISSGRMLVAESSAWAISRSATGSPASVVRRLNIATRAPIRSSTSSTPVRPAPIPMLRKKMRDSGMIVAATIRNAADEISPGTSILSSCSRSTGLITTRPPVVWTVAPAARNMRSVWSRVAVSSITVVGPSARRAASSKADLTCAEETSITCSIPTSF